MKDTQKFFIGVLSGAALGYWLNSNQGREKRSDVYKRVADTGSQLQSQISSQVNSLKSKANSMLKRGVSAAKSTYDDVVDSGDQFWKEVDKSYETGKSNSRPKSHTLEHS